MKVSILHSWLRFPFVAYAAVHSLLKGKREAEEALEKHVSAKKQKLNEGIEQAVKKQKVEAKTPVKKKKKEETSGSDDTSSSDSEEEKKVCILLVFSR